MFPVSGKWIKFEDSNIKKLVMGKLVLFMHVSLDGLIARKGGEMDWISINEEMFEKARERTEQSDTALYGRGTFEIMEAYWPTAGDSPTASKHDIEHSTWYNQVRKLVVSGTLPEQKSDKIQIIYGNVAEQILEQKKKTAGEIIMFGSPTLAASLMNENLIDEYWLFVNPIILGEGNSLFKGNHRELKLTLVEQFPFRSGVVCLHYKNQ
jgi:dihydrofolate reductase